MLEECTIGTYRLAQRKPVELSVSVVVRRMYYWDLERRIDWRNSAHSVSVVVRRMYYWDIKIKRIL